MYIPLDCVTVRGLGARSYPDKCNYIHGRPTDIHQGETDYGKASCLHSHTIRESGADPRGRSQLWFHCLSFRALHPLLKEAEVFKPLVFRHGSPLHTHTEALTQRFAALSLEMCRTLFTYFERTIPTQWQVGAQSSVNTVNSVFTA